MAVSWELNSGPLEEQLVPLTTEPSLQPLTVAFYIGPMTCLVFGSSPFFFLNWIFFIYISNVIPLPSFLSINPLSHIFPFLLWGCSPTQSPTPSCLSALTFPYTGGLSLGETKGFSSLWCLTRPSSATYAAGAMGLSMCTLWMVV